MTGRACAKEELCCRKIKCLVEAHEANLAAGNYEKALDGNNMPWPEGEAWREHIREVIDKSGKKIEKALKGFIDGDEVPSPDD